MDPRGAAAAAATAVLYGSSYVATAIALRGFVPLAAAAARGLVGALALGVVLLVSASPALRPRRVTRASAWRLVVVGALGGPAFIITMNLAVALAGASITAFVAGLYAVLAAVLAVPLLGERLEPLTIGALLLAVLGAALLGEVELGGEQLTGVLVAGAAAVVFGLFLVLLRRWSLRFDLPGPTIGAVGLGGTALIAALLLPVGPPPAPLAEPGGPGLDAILAIAWLGLGPGALAMILVVVGMRRLPARRGSAFMLLNPPTAAIGSWLLLGERFTPAQLVGGVLILAAMAAASGLVRWPGAVSSARAPRPE
jgi:probable blue pigment (indigoidine) exporter